VRAALNDFGSHLPCLRRWANQTRMCFHDARLFPRLEDLESILAQDALVEMREQKRRMRRNSEKG
jgi:hypothetical protein